LPRFQEAGFTVRSLTGRTADEARELAFGCVADGVDTLVVCGGDGLVHVAVQALAHSDTRLGILPSGTGNDVARYLNVPRNDPQAAADVVVAGRERRIDLADTGSEHYVTVLCTGFDARVAERGNAMPWPRGQMRYNLATLAELKVFQPLSYTLELDGVTRELDAMLVAVGNGPSFGGGLRITQGAVLDDGQLDVVVIKPMSKVDLVRTYPKLFTGHHVSHPQYEHHRVRRVRVAAQDVIAYADGERMGPLPMTVGVADKALRVLSAS
jgi:diacylglycerol kinase (ATP)